MCKSSNIIKIILALILALFISILIVIWKNIFFFKVEPEYVWHYEGVGGVCVDWCTSNDDYAISKERYKSHYTYCEVRSKNRRDFIYLSNYLSIKNVEGN